MARKLYVVVSQGQSANPVKRGLEEELVAALLMERGIEVTVVPHLYDLPADGTGMLALKNIPGNLVVCSWLYARAAHWILDRNHIRGQVGATLLNLESDEDADEQDEAEAAESAEEQKARVDSARDKPNRRIYCLDLRAAKEASAFVDEIVRIQKEEVTDTIELTGLLGGSPAPEQVERFITPAERNVESNGAELNGTAPTIIDEAAGRRWYPVIDFSRCTNCLECIDFCLFGVYGVDRVDTILVEQPDNCRKGCPACSRVCPENAIIFPQHKSPAIAGSPEVAAGGFKVDLSKLFGAPDEGAVDAAVRERDEQLMLAGREAVGAEVGLRKRQTERPDSAEKDDLDSLMDQLDELDI